MVDKSFSPSSDSIKRLCAICFDTLQSSLKNTKPTFSFPEELKDKNCPLFVTWKIGKDEDLRGCIGTFVSDSLEKNVAQYALVSALNDTRFEPISIKEFDKLSVGVSLLVNFEKAEPLEWEVGKHGIEIEFNEDKKMRKFSATFLPEVAQEQGWNQTTTLEYLINKAGCNAKLDKVMKNIQLKRYQSIKATMSYEEFKNTKL